MYMEHSGEGASVVNSVSAAWSQVTATVTAMDAALSKWLMETYGVGLADYRALLHLSRASDRELRLNDLARKVGLNQSSVTRLVERLERKELIFRDTCPDDGRGVYAVMTDQGMGAVDAIRDPYEGKVRELLQNATEDYPELGHGDLGRAFEVIGSLIR
ncbi:MarR family winged helix-turn-helix transcriptional regulator [Streptomonospora wellingtoniae]|uniref:MarR family transcriptional regulator n=1 Tax=Streptomonospora wellingtoniae TaxID=3075544 RepID=A0ABU2KNI0_9ACTN|nr:MarR family transcriptional regulator [Streptomonospora sp. DSM 45055]MDT0300826.1 MarR family transcriptional regulator [Streptomonospora sp. DSM 45055]